MIINATGSKGGGSTPVINPLSVTENGTYTAPSGVDGYSPVTVNVSGGGGSSDDDVIFYDYDGTVVESYSADDFANLTAMPANPSHTGLTAQGWNWTLADAKAYVAKYGMLDIGQMYITDDGKTRLYCHFVEGRLSPYLGLGINGTVTVDWGDGSATETMTGSSLTTVVNRQHVYASAGNYVITLTATSGNFSFFGESSGSHVLKETTNISSTYNAKYRALLDKVELGTGALIGNYGFDSCYSLSIITLPNHITSFGTTTLSDCRRLLAVNVPNGTTLIDEGLFTQCRSLQFVTMPKSVASIGVRAFNACDSLKRIVIPEGISSIPDYAFSEDYSLSNIKIPDSVTSIGQRAFYNCSALTDLEIPDNVTTIGTYAFYGCRSLKEIAIPRGVTSIESYTFGYCSSLSKVTLHDGITTMGQNAFSNCTSLHATVLTNGMTSVPKSIFYNCSSLLTVTIPQNITALEYANTFYSCSNIIEFHIKPTTPPTLAASVFPSTSTLWLMYVPAASLEAYKTATNWSTYANYMVGE